MLLGIVGLTLTPALASAQSGQRIDVRIPLDGLWTAYLQGFDTTQVRSVTYYWRDAQQQWHHARAQSASPFDADIPWWEGSNNGYEAVTAHVTFVSGKELRDPGGWHWVDGRHANPKGSLTAATLKVGYSATYRPAAEAGQLAGAEFWLRDSTGIWHDAGAGEAQTDASWTLSPLQGDRSNPWTGSIDSISIHAVWPNGSQWVDPAAWVTQFDSKSEAAPAAETAPVATPAAGPKGTLSNHTLTPGATFSGATAADVCVPGWAAAHRHVTNEQHRLIFAEYGIQYPEPAGAYELDHLIPLELGGDNENSNLWPQAASPAPGFHQKDALENRLHALVCGGTLDLAAAQAAIATDWYSAYIKFVASAPSVATSVVPSAPVIPTPPPAVVAPPAQAPPPPAPQPADPMASLRAQGISAICNDGTYSMSKNRSGTCSHHLGVGQWTGLI